MRALLLLLALVSAGLAHAAPPVEVDLLYTSDIHGYIGRSEATFLNPQFPPTLGGGASIAWYVNQVREQAAAEHRTVLLFDAGDLFTGAPVGVRTGGEAVIEWMNEIRYTAAALGNHDFDQGWENAKHLTQMAEFPVLAGNLYDAKTGKRVPWVSDHLMIEADGIRIAVLGYITESTVYMSFERNVEGLDFRPVHEIAPADVKRMRDDGADLVFVIIHHGLPHPTELKSSYERMLEREANGELPHENMSALELAHVIEGVDLWLAGHTHQGYDQPWEDPKTHALVFEPYARGSSLGHVTLKIDPETRSLIGYDTHFDRGALLTLTDEDVWPDEAVADEIQKRVREAERGLDEVVGETRVPLAAGPPQSSLLGRLVTDAFREELDADFAIQNTGGLRGNLAPGPITERDLLNMSPFGNQLVIVQMPGSMLRGMMEDKLSPRGSGLYFSGGHIVWNPDGTEGSRILTFEVGGEPIDPDRIYNVVMSDYLAEGNSGLDRLRQLPPESTLYTSLIDREVLSRYIRARGVIDMRSDGRWEQKRVRS